MSYSQYKLFLNIGLLLLILNNKRLCQKLPYCARISAQKVDAIFTRNFVKATNGSQKIYLNLIYNSRFEQQGVKFIKRPNDGKMKGLAFIQDPDGYWIEIFTSNVV